MTGPVRPRLWFGYLAAMLVATGVYFLLGGVPVAQAIVLLGMWVALVGAIVVGIRRNRPSRPGAWYVLLAGQVVYVAAWIPFYLAPAVWQTSLPFPSVADWLFLSAYTLLIAGLWLFIRQQRQGRDRDALLDMLIAVVGLGTLSWLYLMSPHAYDGAHGIPARIVAAAYPTADLVIVGLAVRLIMSRTARTPAYWLLILWAVSQLASDTIYAFAALEGSFRFGDPLFLGWLLTCPFLGGAALHPTMATLSEPGPVREGARSRLRLIMLGAAALVGPVEMVLHVTRGRTTDLAIVAVASGVVFVLVLLRLSGAMTDLSELQRTQRQLSEAEDRYRSLVEHIPAITYIDAVEGDPAVYISPQTESILGFSQQDWFDDPKLMSKLVHPDDRPAWEAAVAHMDATGEPLCIEYRLRARDGRVLWFHDEAVLVHGADGRPRFWQGVMFDVTALKDAEEALRSSYEREREAATHLRRLDEMKNDFLSAVSHELRTPLTSIMGIALTLDRGDLTLPPQEQQALLHRLSANARKLTGLLSDLLDVDRLARGVMEVRRQTVDLEALTDGVLSALDPEGRPVRARVALKRAYVDGAKVERILENLVTNAVKYTPPGTPVSVEITALGQGVLIAVEDGGEGIPDRQKQAIFEAFRRAGGSAHSPGTGIGLALVARFAELHGGRAWVQDRPGGGSSFRVFLDGAEDTDPPKGFEVMTPEPEPQPELLSPSS